MRRPKFGTSTQFPLILVLIATAATVSAQEARTTVEIADADKAHVVEPGTTVTLRVRVAAGAEPGFTGEVLFVVPDQAASGTFPASSEPGGRVLVVPVTTGGEAEATLVTSAAEGFFLASAWAVGTDAVETVAITNRAGAGQPALDAVGALARLRGDAGLAPNQEDLRVHGPFLLPGGTEYGPAVLSSPLDGDGPQVALEDSWFFWIDDLPGAKFGHPVRYVLIPASGGAPDIPNISVQAWWPVLGLPGDLRRHSLAGDLNGIRTSRFAGSPSAVAALQAAALHPERRNAPAGNCFLAVYGPDLNDGDGDLEDFRDYLLEQDLVNPDKVFMTEGNRVAKASDLADLAKKAQAAGCKKLFLLIHAHGSRGKDPGLHFAPEKEGGRTSFTSYEQLATDTLTPLRGMDIWGIVDACYGGQFSTYLEGRGYQGAIFSSASRDVPSWMRYYGSVFQWYFLEALKANGPGKTWEDAFVTASQKATVDANKFLDPGGAAFLEGAPGFADLDPNGIRSLATHDIRLPGPGPKSTGISLPPDFNKSGAYKATLTIQDRSLAQVAGAPRVFSQLTVPLVGRQCGESQYQMLIEETTSGERWFVQGRIQVGHFRLDKDVVSASVDGGEAVVTMTRFGSRADQRARMLVRSSDSSVARWKFDLPRPVSGTTAPIEIVPVGPGETELEILLETGSGVTKNTSKKKIRVVVTAGEQSSTGCPLNSGSAVEVAGAMIAVESNGNNMLEKSSESIGEDLPEMVNFVIEDGEIRGDSGWFPAMHFFQFSEGCRGEVSDVLITNNGSGIHEEAAPKDQGLAVGNASVGGELEFTGANFDQFSYTPRYRELGDSPPGGRGDLRLVITGTAKAGAPVRFSANPIPVMPRSGGELEVAVVAGEGASWTAMSDSPFLQFVETAPAAAALKIGRATQAENVGQKSGTGGERLIVVVSPNSGLDEREGTLMVGGDTLTIRQEGADSRTPSIASGGVVGGASFTAGVVSGGWTSILGDFFLDGVRVWGDDDFIAPSGVFAGGRTDQAVPGALLPTALDGVSASVDGRPTFISFTSAGQLNVLIDDSETFGDVEVQVTTPDGTSVSASVFKHRYLPEFFRFQPDGLRFVAGVHPDGTFLGPEGLFNGLTTRPARPGDVVLLFGTGWGPTMPASPSPVLVTTPQALATPAVIRIGGAPALVQFAGLVGSGLYQFNVVVPDVGPGEQPIEGFVAGVPIERRAFIAVGE